MESDANEDTDDLKTQLKMALVKPPSSRSYDDLLLLKQYIAKTEFITKHFAGIANPNQMNEICKSMRIDCFGIGHVVFKQGDPGDKVYVILTGICVFATLLIDSNNTEKNLVFSFVIIYFRDM
jgi:hypothetical protein